MYIVAVSIKKILEMILEWLNKICCFLHNEILTSNYGNYICIWKGIGRKHKKIKLT